MLDRLPSELKFDSTALLDFWNKARKILPERTLSERFIESCEKSLHSGDWTEIGEAFRSQTFIGKERYFALLGPYRTLRSGVQETSALGLVGQVLATPDYSSLSDIALDLVGPLADPVMTILPVHFMSVLGDVGREDGEAFIVPDGWGFPDSVSGPALNDMAEQLRRFEMGAKPCIRRIFEPASAELIIAAFEMSQPRWALQHREFQYHEVGHATGLGLRRKLREGLLASPWYRGVEEWRADGIAFELLARTLSPREAGMTIAANFALRFGVDAQRGGGMERDTDVGATLLTFESLFSAGVLRIGRERKLEFTVETYEGLVRATERMRSDALTLTREESALNFSQGIWGLYGSRYVSPGVRRLFQGMVVDPCSGIFSTLR